jgi:hypothetical protein
MGSLKRRVSMEDETIGWPIDVAVVTKSEWFIRIKKKSYFDASLNPHYFK